jgi:hypothetical protein
VTDLLGFKLKGASTTKSLARPDAAPKSPILSVVPRLARVAPGRGALGVDRRAPMMMRPPNRRRQRIASNPEQLLNAALKRHDPMLSAYQVMGMNIVATVPYAPEPDVAAIRDDENPDRRYGDRFYLVADVLSENDKGIIDGKRDSYQAHPSCICILLVRQDRPEVSVDRRAPDGWRTQSLQASEELTLPELGLTCSVSDIYRDTPGLVHFAHSRSPLA